MQTNFHVVAKCEACNASRQSQLFVELVATNTCKVVALCIEQQIVQSFLNGFVGGDFARTQTLVDFYQRFLVGCCVVLQESQRKHRVVLEQLCNGVATTAVSKRTVGQNTTEQNCDGQLSVAVDVNVQNVVVCIVFHFQPSATAGHCRCVVHRLAVFVHFDGTVHARGTNKLANDNTFCAVDDETAGIRHKWEIAHENFLVDELAGTFVCQTNSQAQWACIGCVTQTALCFVVLGRGIDAMAEKFQTEMSSHVLDGRKIFKYFGNTFAEECLVAGFLHLDEIWQRQNFLCLGERFSFVITVLNGLDVLWH